MNTMAFIPKVVVTESHEHSLLVRIMEACLREDVFGLLSGGKIVHAPFTHVGRQKADENILWHRSPLKDGGFLYFAVKPAVVIQRYKILYPFWYYQPAREENISENAPVLEQGLERFLHRLGCGQDAEIQSLIRDFAVEAYQALEQGALCRQVYQQDKAKLHDAFDLPSWHARLLAFDRIASFTDHPLYPTARAKSGLSTDEIMRYAPEYAPQFKLKWLAVPKAELLHTSPVPKIWPQMNQIGFSADLAQTHAVLPVHPLTWPALITSLPEGFYKAPLSYATVTPTLSVRTVASMDDPHIHIKLPLYMRTLGARNIRLIKPSTITDGHIFQQILMRLADQDPALKGMITHVNERHGAYINGRSDMAYIVRCYPPDLEEETPVPVAALATLLADGRPVMAHLADRFFGGDIQAWAQAHVRQLLQVHMRLWLKYGIALEANQQNSVFLYHKKHMRLLLKDNDSARVIVTHLVDIMPDLKGLVQSLVDKRIITTSSVALMEMFCTIILQLCIMAPFEALLEAGFSTRAVLYGILQDEYAAVLAQLKSEGVEVKPAVELQSKGMQPVKYLLSAGTLLPKSITSAADINKHYGWSGQNFLAPSFLQSNASA